MLYSQAQVDKLLENAGRDSEEFKALLKLEEEIRKGYHPVYADSFDGKEVERILTQIDLIRTE